LCERTCWLQAVCKACAKPAEGPRRGRAGHLRAPGRPPASSSGSRLWPTAMSAIFFSLFIWGGGGRGGGGGGGGGGGMWGLQQPTTLGGGLWRPRRWRACGPGATVPNCSTPRTHAPCHPPLPCPSTYPPHLGELLNAVHHDAAQLHVRGGALLRQPGVLRARGGGGRRRRAAGQAGVGMSTAQQLGRPGLCGAFSSLSKRLAPSSPAGSCAPSAA
jgi:hypothetical protein